MIIRVFLVVLMVLLYAQDVRSQLFQRKRKRTNEHPPKAILVEIKTHQRRQQYYQQHELAGKQAQLLKDIDSVRERMVMDFTDNFNYCPVYYFIDTNRSKILAGRFEGVLLDNNLKPAANISMQPADNYHIVYFGYTISAPDPQSNGSATGSGEANARSSRQRLVVLDKNGKAVKRPLPNGSNSGSGGVLKRNVKTYRYRSPLLEIYYVPYAGDFNQKLYSFYGLPTNSESQQALDK